MTTENPRVQVMLDKETSGLLATLAAANHRSVSAAAAALIREGLELQEDRLLSRHGDARFVAVKTWMSPDDAWG